MVIMEITETIIHTLTIKIIQIQIIIMVVGVIVLILIPSRPIIKIITTKITIGGTTTPILILATMEAIILVLESGGIVEHPLQVVAALVEAEALVALADQPLAIRVEAQEEDKAKQ